MSPGFAVRDSHTSPYPRVEGPTSLARGPREDQAPVSLAFLDVPIEQRWPPDQAGEFLAIGDNAAVLAKGDVGDVVHVRLLQLIGNRLALGGIGLESPLPRQVDDLPVARPAVPGLLAILDVGVEQRIADTRQRRVGDEEVPADLARRILGGAPLGERAPIHGL